MATPRRNTRHIPPSRNQQAAGDFTGRERVRLAEENAAEIAESQKRLGLQTAAEAAAEADGIFDPASQDVVEGAPSIIFEDEADLGGVDDEDEALYDPSDQPTAYETLQQLQEPQTQQKPVVLGGNEFEIAPEPPRPVGVTVVEDPLVIFRVNADIEEMTFGRKVSVDPASGEQIVGELQTLSFYRGRRYKAPAAIYAHLEERGLIYH